jgi:hypothetical protein
MRDMLNLYRETFYMITKNALKYNFDDVIMKRLHLGLYGIMKIGVMETWTENLIKELFPLLI